MVEKITSAFKNTSNQLSVKRMSFRTLLNLIILYEEKYCIILDMISRIKRKKRKIISRL